MLQLVGIKSNQGYYITDNLENKSYHNSSIGNSIINGELPVKSFKSGWFIVKSEPKLIQRTVNQPNINHRFELKNKELSDKFKEVYLKDEVYLGWDDDRDYIIYTDEFKDISSLYESKSDPQEPLLEDVEFEYQTITEIDIDLGFKFSYATSGYWPNDKGQPVTQNSIKYNIIDEIITPPILLETKPSKLSKKESYEIVRQYIRDNINPVVAEITSNYDFCFTVKKKIKLAKDYVYQIDVNDTIFGNKKKKPKYETRTRRYNSIQIFEIAPAPYQSYSVIEPFEGDNAEDLKNNIDAYLTHIIGVINEPLIYCECCDGTGVKLSTI